MGNANVAVDGQALRRHRKLAGLSVTGLAEQVGCTPAYISILETRRERNCSPGLFARIADTLGVEDRSTLLREPERSAA